MTDIKYSYQSLRKRNMPAIKALETARKAEKTIYGKESLYYNSPVEGTKNRWVEKAGEGLRFVGYADEISQWINHEGWYTSEHYDEKYRGAVYQLPARNGKEQYVYGYADPNNDGCAFICFDITDDKTDAAKLADRFAETEAEKSREYNDAWQAGSNYQSLGEELAQERKETLELLQAIKSERGRGAKQVICDALQSQVKQHIRAWHKLKEKRAELWAEYEHLQLPHNRWRKHLWSAFNEGAGQNVIA